MKKAKKIWRFFSWQTLIMIVVVCLLNSVAWIAIHGVPLIGLPNKDEVTTIIIRNNNIEQKTITDLDDIALLVNAANLCNYRLFGKVEGQPAISVTYYLSDDTNITLEANSNTMWWHGAAHSLNETNTFVNVINGLFFYATE